MSYWEAFTEISATRTILRNLSYFRIHRYLETAWSQIEYIDTDRAREVLVEFLLLRWFLGSSRRVVCCFVYLMWISSSVRIG